MKIKGSPKPSYDPDESVDYECRPGYKRTQSRPIQTVCLNNGSWSELKESCTPKSCPTPAVPRNGEITNRKGSFLFGSEAHYRCFEGFHLQGKAVIYCQLVDYGVDWSDNPPLCEKINCLPPEKIQNGKFSHSEKSIFEYSDVVTYSCNPPTTSDPFSLIGPKTRVCSANGTWSGTAPQCKVVVCPPPEVINGTLKSGFSRKYYYNDRVIFECQQGFVFQDNDEATCDADNRWKPALPTCIPGPTTPVTTSPPASRDPSETRPSDTPPESSGSLDTWIIVVIVLITAIGVALIGFIVYKYQSRKKRESKISEASYSTYRNKSQNPVEESDSMVNSA